MTRMTTRSSAATARAMALVALFCLAGCFKLSRPSPPMEHFVLGGARTTASADPMLNGDGITIGLRRLDLAPYLSTHAIVVRRGTHQIVVSEFHRWGEDPGDGINREVGAHLASAPPVRSVDIAPWPVRSQHDYLVQLHVARFEGVADSAATEGGVHVLASWDIIRAEDGTVLARGSTDYREGRWSVGNYGGLVTLLDAGLGHVARDIRACLVTLHAGAACS